MVEGFFLPRMHGFEGLDYLVDWQIGKLVDWEIPALWVVQKIRTSAEKKEHLSY